MNHNWYGLCERKNSRSKPKINNNREPRAKSQKTEIEKIRERREAREDAKVGKKIK